MYTVVIRYVYGYTVETINVIEAPKKLNCNSRFFSHSLDIPSYNFKTMAHHHTRDNPDLQNIIPDDQKRKRNATDRAQGVDSYFRAVEAATKPRQAHG
jgi:hypothetical protein